MQPIKTTNAMNPAPAKGIESFPTPVIDDVVISEIVNAWKGDYQPLEYGTLWKDVSHAPNQGSFPEHKLVYQQPTSEDGQWVKRIWVNDRVNQDSYNYAIKYSAGSQDHPIYIRTYIVPRETYAPLLDGTPDPLFPSALLVDEEAQRSEGELDSKYITVTRVYETLPGPKVPTKRYNERGDLETVIRQTVSPNTPPDPDGLLVTGSQVEQVETGKGVKTTSTVQDHSLLQIKENKEGLLGETITTDDIVDPSTNPDALSETIVSSVVEQYTATKARKRTTTSSGPKKLSQKSRDGKLLGDITSTESVVAFNSDPDAVSSKILLSEVRQIDSGKAIKRNIVLNSTPTLFGNQKEQGLLGNKTTKESIVPSGTNADDLSLSIISSSVEPIDSVRSRKVTIESNGPNSLSGGQNKEGLLGETIVSESIVAIGSSPDPLSKNIISSVVEPIDSAKSKKITIEAIGPTSLNESSKDGKLLGDITSTQSIVGPNELPDDPSPTIISSNVKQIDSGKAVKTNIVLNSTPILSGDQKEQGLLGNKTITESIVAAGEQADQLSMSVLSSQVDPIDSVRSRKVTVTSNGPSSLVGGEKGAGLLGEVTVTESIVPSGTQPDNLSSTVVSSSITPIDQYKSKKTTSTSVGPQKLSGQRINERGEIETVEESIVAVNSSPDKDGVNVISSEVDPIDNAKSKKTTVTVNSRVTLSGGKSSSGLLGNTSVTESIVSYPAFPDQLSWGQNGGGVIESTVDPISATKARKTTVTSSSPQKLGDETLIDSPLGLVKAKVEKSIVKKGTQPQTIASKNIKLVKDDINNIDSVKSERETVTVDDWPTNIGVDSDEQLGFGVKYTETIVSPNEFLNKPYWIDLDYIDYKPLDQWKSLKREVDREKLAEVLLEKWIRTPIQVNVNLPDKLLGVTVYWGHSYAKGQTFSTDFSPTATNYSLSSSGSSKSSYGVSGDIYFNVQQGYSGPIKGEKHIFFIEIGDDGRVAENEILETLNNFAAFGTRNKPSSSTPPPSGELIETIFEQTPENSYQPWPYIQTRTENLVVISGGKSETMNSSQSQFASINGFGQGKGSGSSIDVDVNARSVNVPPSLHGSITIKEEIIGSTGGQDLLPTIGVRPQTLQATKAVVAGQLKTMPQFPVGKFLYQADVELYKYGFVKVTAITVEVTPDYV